MVKQSPRTRNAYQAQPRGQAARVGIGRSTENNILKNNVLNNKNNGLIL